VKREISILLLCCFALYHFGFYIFYFSSRYQIEADWKTEIFNGKLKHHKARLVEIPLSVPYMPEQVEFQSANVPFQENGIKYRVVKQRYVKDTLQIIFVPDLALGKLDQTLKGWMGTLINGLNQTTDPNQALIKNVIKDYHCPLSSIKIFTPDSIIYKSMGFLVNFYQNVYLDLASPPPEIS
jgi:hypothetical protein